MLYAGTSGFSYPAWRGSFYPARLAAARMLAYYAERLNGVELNGSFYRTPPPETLTKWGAQAPEGFRFCLKAHRGLTYSAPPSTRRAWRGRWRPGWASWGRGWDRSSSSS